MVKIYPYTLKVLIQEPAVFKQDTATWLPAEENWVTISKCRDEINGTGISGSGAKITTEDSQYYKYSTIVYTPRNIPILKRGVKIQVWDRDILRVEGEVMRFSKDQLHSRIWL